MLWGWGWWGGVGVGGGFLVGLVWAAPTFLRRAFVQRPREAQRRSTVLRCVNSPTMAPPPRARLFEGRTPGGHGASTESRESREPLHPLSPRVSRDHDDRSLPAEVASWDGDRYSNALLAVFAFCSLLALVLLAVLTFSSFGEFLEAPVMAKRRGGLRHNRQVRGPLSTQLDGPDTYIILRVMHGLGNRMRAYASCAAIANATGRRLAVLWEADMHLNATFHELFEQLPNLTVINAPAALDEVYTRRDDVRSFKLLAAAEPEDKRARRLSFFKARRLGIRDDTRDDDAEGDDAGDDSERHIYVKTSRLIAPADIGLKSLPHLLASGRRVGGGCATRCRLQLMLGHALLQLRPVSEVRRRLREITAAWAAQALVAPSAATGPVGNLAVLSRHLVGAHVRMVHNLTLDVPRIDSTTDPDLSKGAMADMPSHRRRCGWRHFVLRTREALRALPPPALLYVASDTLDAASSLCRATGAGGRRDGGGRTAVDPRRFICVSLPSELLRPCFGEARRGAACARVALIELYALGASATLLYSDASSFSSIALMLGKSAGSLGGTHPGCDAGLAPETSQPNATYIEGLTMRAVPGGGRMVAAMYQMS